PKHRCELVDVQERRADPADEETRDDRPTGIDPARRTIGLANVHRLEIHAPRAKELLGCLAGCSSRLPDQTGKVGHAVKLQQPLAELSALRSRAARTAHAAALLV